MQISRGQFFSKLYMLQAYQQLTLDEDGTSGQYTKGALLTHKTS